MAFVLSGTDPTLDGPPVSHCCLPGTWKSQIFDSYQQAREMILRRVSGGHALIGDFRGRVAHWHDPGRCVALCLCMPPLAARMSDDPAHRMEAPNSSANVQGSVMSSMYLFNDFEAFFKSNKSGIYSTCDAEG